MTAYDELAEQYAVMLPDLRAESALELAMLSTFAAAAGQPDLGPVAELGCGTGRVMSHLRSLGLGMIGMDLSRGMVSVGRRAYPGAHFALGSIAALPFAGGHLGGILAWYSTIHTPAPDLQHVFHEFARALAPGAPLLVGFHVGDENQPRKVTYPNGVSLTVYDLDPATARSLAVGAGLTVRAELMRAPEGKKTRPRACLLATKSARRV
ncbi:MAG TPA: class I SAM-dependent methyltransferase [Acidimicrobiales bacterium]|nr:class I SAM-dependent methyltransferase [Acidimicrobiales bacterium]